MEIQPLNDYVLILPDEKRKQTKGGFVLPDSEAEMTYMAKVIAVGEGRTDDNGKLIPMKVKIGDTILHKSYGLTSLKIDDKEHFILEERQVLGIVKEEK